MVDDLMEFYLFVEVIEFVVNCTFLCVCPPDLHTYFLSFAIDWRPAQRLLVYLKSAALVCHLEVEEGYPNAGQTQLLSVQRDGRPVDTSVLKVPEPQDM